MNLTIDQQTLATALNVAGRSVANRSTLPVLSNVMLNANGAGLAVQATDLSTAITYHVPASIAESGSITIPAGTFGDLVKQSPQERIALTLNGDTTVAYECASISAKLRGIEATEFPMIPSADGLYDDGATEVALPSATLRKMIDAVAFAAATDDTRPVLTGVLVEIDADEVKMVAADGFRLSVYRQEIDTTATDSLQLIIPAKALQEVARLLGDESVSLLVPQDKRQVCFDADSWEVVTQLIDGNFPDYNMIIPDSYGLSFSVDVAELRQVLARANVYAREAANIVRFAVDAEAERMTVRAETAEMGDFEEPVAINVDKLGADIEIAFNVVYVSNLLANMPTERITWRLNSASSPGWFRPVPATGAAFQHVIMPMSIGNR